MPNKKRYSIKFINDLQNEFEHKELITTDDLKQYLSFIYPDYNMNSIYWLISDLNKQNIIERVSRGYYKVYKRNEKSEKMTVVLMGDIKDSRKLFANDPDFERSIIEKIQKDFGKIDDNLEVATANTLFDIISGDELNYYSEFNDLFIRKLLIIMYHVRPAYLRFVIAVGVGYLKETDEFLRMNNELFWNARDYFDSPEFKKSRDANYNALVWPKENILENAMLSLILLTITNWTSKQWEVVYYKQFGYSYMKIAEIIGVSRQAVQERLSVANYQLVEESLIELVKQMRG